MLRDNIDEMVALKRSGKTYREIGDIVGCSHERVRQLIKTKVLDLDEEIVTHKKLAEIFNLPVGTVTRYVKELPVSPLSSPGHRIVYRSQEVLPLLTELIRKKTTCRVCGRMIDRATSNHYLFCSDECYMEANNVLHRRSSFRRLKIRRGQKITTSCDLKRNVGDQVYSKCRKREEKGD